MRSRLAACLLFAALLGLAPSAKAVDMNPGDSCSGFPAGAYRPTGGQENPDGAFVVCDGSIWQPILRYSSAGNAVMFSSTGMPAAPVHVWGEAIIGNQGLACGAEQEGALRYTSAGDLWAYCDGASWVDLASGSGTPAAAGSDRQIQFNSGGSFGAGANFVFDSAGNVGIGTASPAVPLDVAGDINMSSGSAYRYDNQVLYTRLIADDGTVTQAIATESEHTAFDPSQMTNADNLFVGKGAGDDITTGRQNVFVGKLAGEFNTSGRANTFVGRIAGRVNTTGMENTMIGSGAGKNNKTGDENTIIGHQAGTGSWGNTDDIRQNVFIGDAAATNVLNGARYNVVIGDKSAPTLGAGEGNIILGQGADVQFSSQTNFLNIGDAIYGNLSAGNVGIGATTPATRLDAAGTLKLAYGGEACDANREGAIRYDSGTTTFSFCADDASGWESISLGSGSTLAGLDDTNLTSPASGEVLTFDGTDWVNQAAGGGSPAGSDREIQFNSGGSFGAGTNFVYTSVGDLIVGSYQLDDTGTGNEDSRMYFDVSNSAFRAGSVPGNEWDFSSAGQYSAAFGELTEASGAHSFAAGKWTEASGDRSVAMGTSAQATGSAAVALGNNLGAYGNNSVALGSFTYVEGLNAFGFGKDSFIDGDYSFALGKGAVTASTADLAGALGQWASVSAPHSYAIGSNATTTSSATGSMAIALNDNTTGSINRHVSGTYSLGIFMGDQGDIELSSANTMGVFGGKMIINPSIPTTNLSADAALEVDGTLKIAYGGESCDTSREGALYYDSAADRFKVCQTAGAWEDIATGNASAAGSDRQIQFNSAGAFGAATNFVYTSAGDLIVGSYQIDDTGTGNEDSRMFFDVSKGAFRAGRVTGTQWDDANSGINSTATGIRTTASGWGSTAMGDSTTASGGTSTAMGDSTTASGDTSTAMGWNTTASGDDSTAMGAVTTASGRRSTAMGALTTASGDYSTAMGRRVMAGDGTAGSGKGDNSVAFGLGASTSGQEPQLTGINAAGFFMGAQDNVVFASSNTMGIFGGRVVIDPRDPATNLSADTALEVEGALKIAYDAQSCAAASEGAIRYDSATDAFEVCATAGSWSALGGSAVAGADRQIQLNSAGSFAGDTNFVYTSAGDLIVGSYQLDDTGTGNEDSRMYFDVSNSAFRAGSVPGNQWDFSSAGRYSTAFGQNTVASAWFSVAMGSSTTASGSRSVAMGGSTIASGSRSVAMGGQTTASGHYSAALGGLGTTASGDYSTVIGMEAIAGDGTAGNGKGDYSVVFGLGNSTGGQYPQLTGQNAAGFFMGAQDNVVFASSNTMGIFGGRVVIDPRDPATNLSADTALEVAGGIKLDFDSESCVAAKDGTLRFNSAGGALELCDGGSWGGVGTDNLGDHTATQNVLLNGNWLSNDGANEGVFVDTAGNVGIGDATPDHMLDVAGNLGLAAGGYLNFGDTDGSGGYGVRDNAGTIECKDSGGSWAACAGGGSGGTLGDLSDVTIAAGPDGTVADSFSTPGSSPLGLTWDGTNLWHADYTDDTIYKLDTAGNVQDSFASPDALPMGLTWDGTNLWHSDTNSDTIYKLDPSDGSVLDSFASPAGDPRGLAWDGTNLWHADAGTDTIYKLDPSNGNVLDSFSSPDSAPQGLTWDGTNLWNAGNNADTIYQVDTSGSILDSFASPDSTPRGMAWDGTNLWNVGAATATIYKFGNSRSDGEILSYNKASGEWENAAGGSTGGGTPGGNDTEIQFNNDGNFGASADLTFASGQLRLGGQTGLPAPAAP